MATIKVYHEITVDGKTITGDRLAATTLSDVTNMVAYLTVSVAATNTSQVLWATTNAGITTFTRACIISDQDIFVELRNDNGTAEYAIILVEANTPFWIGAELGADTTESADGAALVDGTDFDDIDRIEVQNEGSTAANVQLLMFT
jgi:hypothetical protein